MTLTPTRGPTPRTGVREHADVMSNITTYLVSASLILLVIRQIREHPLDARSLAVPVLAVGAAAVMFLHSIPAGGSDLALEAAGVAGRRGDGRHRRAGHPAAPGRRRPGRSGRAGILAAGMWIGGVGARLAFAVAAGNGAGPAIARFSVAHQITGSAAWIAALVMMALADVLTRLVVIYLRGRRRGRRRSSQYRCGPGRRPRLTANPPAAASCRRAAAPRWQEIRSPGECPGRGSPSETPPGRGRRRGRPAGNGVSHR